MDEFDAISMSRSREISEAAMRILSTLLSELDGFEDKKSDLLVLTLAATNTPWSLDQAVLSRFPKRVYVPLPDHEACSQIIRIKINGLEANVDVLGIAKRCVDKNLSGRDIHTLCQEAIWNMIRSENPNLAGLAKLPFEEIRKRSLKIRPLVMEDFEEALRKTKSPLLAGVIERYEKWNEEFGG